MPNMANCNYYAGALGLVLGALIMYAAAAFPLQFTENGPGAGFWPFCLGLALAVAALVLLLYTALNRAELRLRRVALAAAGNRRVYLLLGMMLVYCLLLPLVGFYPASVLLIPLVMRTLGQQNKKYLFCVTAGTLLFIYLIFGVALHTQLPQSMFL